MAVVTLFWEPLSRCLVCVSNRIVRETRVMWKRGMLPVSLSCTSLVFTEILTLCNDCHVQNIHFQLWCPISWWPRNKTCFFSQERNHSFVLTISHTISRGENPAPPAPYLTRSDKQCVIASFLFLFPALGQRILLIWKWTGGHRKSQERLGQLIPDAVKLWNHQWGT